MSNATSTTFENDSDRHEWDKNTAIISSFFLFDILLMSHVPNLMSNKLYKYLAILLYEWELTEKNTLVFDDKKYMYNGELRKWD